MLAAGVLALGAVIRLIWLTADPPTSLGIVWHDEGAWTHNARNAALWGEWITDGWNPVFVSPVFTALEYTAFEVAGVGLWQARLVPALSGVAAVLLLMLGLRAVSGTRAALVGGFLLATEFTWVMWNRAALMESTMTTCLVAAWAAYAASERRARWGLAAGAATSLAWFTKAAAAFFVAAIVFDAVVTVLASRSLTFRHRFAAREPAPAEVRGALYTLAGLAVTAAVAIVFFVAPYWTDYEFANWQMAVARKPSYDAGNLVDRATWLPIVQDYFTRLWPLFVLALVAVLGAASRWARARPAERLLALWIVVGLVELVVHDAGNERRYVMFIPAIIALASLRLTDPGPWLPAALASWRVGRRVLVLPIIGGFAYLAAGAILRIPFASDVAAGDFKTTVRLTSGLAALTAMAIVIWWKPTIGRLAERTIRPSAALLVVVVIAPWHLGQYAVWAVRRTDLNYRASVAVNAALPPGTLVHGKLANGLALESRIRPVFIGRDFANYHDRLERDDVRYILTYDLPREGYESQPGLIAELLAQYPTRRVVAAFDVEETTGVDRAVLIEKRPGADSPTPGPARARD
jgi:4-amino-4-deoxy-L-arabinose transferase-like glycosyltransferase